MEVAGMFYLNFDHSEKVTSPPASAREKVSLSSPVGDRSTSRIWPIFKVSSGQYSEIRDDVLLGPGQTSVRSEGKEVFSIFSCFRGKDFQRQVANLCNGRGGFPNKGRFAALATIGDRGQVGSVGFHH